jgi:hypothetical protein
LVVASQQLLRHGRHLVRVCAQQTFDQLLHDTGTIPTLNCSCKLVPPPSTLPEQAARSIQRIDITANHTFKPQRLPASWS